MTRLVIAAAFAVALSVAAAQEKKEPAKKDESKLSKEEQEVIDDDAERKKADLPPLKVNPKLMPAAAARREHGEAGDAQARTRREGAIRRVKAAGYKLQKFVEDEEHEARRRVHPGEFLGRRWPG